MPIAPDSTAVVTGAAGGIGRALAARLVAEGVRVVINDIDDVRLTETAKEIGAHPVAGDAASVEGVARLVEAAKDHLGQIDTWYGNAGIDRGIGLDCPEEDWQASHEVNVMAHVRAARLLVPDWVERKAGRYVVTASAAGLLMMIGAPTYTVTKHGAVAFAEWLSATYRHHGIVVQAICPQGVQTGMLERSGVMKDLLSRDVALTPEQVADAAWEATTDDRFLVLPHPEVGDYYAARATQTDKWLGGMNRLWQHVEGQV
ncbi:SDR family oxidoreductase [Nocardioides luteus]|uniref:SDR family oxidoreductase n=1 Tax=Nocardioides luteus TaxID=1844 RepID=UPI0018C922B0|nr:SDR family oxidoreductase [Nocardioides luteus]MBG6098505.1 NAD(P)-dependent dehydrogenase (short-subunit alcohol dehydrogenase family) [Nocardioides luteus]